ncbi:MAG: dephospho-CoA kinase [Actinomycetota bacterium]|nr:dephospho-CoA kinase [Actinomycetota bacterium]
MLQVGLTGGIGAGKSTVSALLAARGAVVIDADSLAREVVARGTEGWRQVVAEFGPDVVGEDGALDRAALGRVVFSDPVRRTALNRIVHPLVRARSDEIVASLPPDSVVVHDIPLLAENGLAARFDLVVVVDVPVELQVERLLARGLPEQEARMRIAAQAAREERRAIADVVLDNSGSRDDLVRQVEDLWRRIDELLTGRV